MKIQTFSQPLSLAGRPIRPSLAPIPSAPVPADSVDTGTSSVTGSALKSALVGAAYGALVGAGSSLLYKGADLGTATLVHAGGILAGGALGAGVLGKVMQPKIEAPASYALGALAGAGVTWATSAFGMLPGPTVGVVAGATLGAFFGAVGGAIHASGQPADRESPKAARPDATGSLPKGAWNALAVAYGVGGTAISGAMLAMAASGHLTAGAAVAGGLVAAGAFTNAYMLYRK